MISYRINGAGRLGDAVERRLPRVEDVRLPERSKIRYQRPKTKDQSPILLYSLEEGAVESLAEDDVDNLDGREGARVQLVRAGPAGRKGYGITVDLTYRFSQFLSTL